MDNLLPMAIVNKYDAAGYVYFVRFNYCKNCYKIGSTGNLYKRLRALSNGRSFDTDLIVCGYAFDRFGVERKIQEIFYKYSNNATFQRRDRGSKFQFVDAITSIEHFIFDTRQVCDVIAAFDMLCNSVQFGTDNPIYKVHPKCVSIGYGEELLKCYDVENDEYVPYPTEFYDNWWPKMRSREEWDSIPMTKPIENFGV